MDLEPAEIRVLGSLLEKQRTTPDAYPLSLNALRQACNQATNRDPVVDYDEATVRDALHRLGRRRLTRLASGAGSRAAKYRHLLDEALPMGRDEQAVMCVLMLRGPQTPGELKQRAERLHPFADLPAIGLTLDGLVARGLVARLERRPGQKEERYRELLGAVRNGHPASNPPVADSRAVLPPPSPADPGSTPAASHQAAPIAAELDARVARLERALAELADERIARLEAAVDRLRESC